MEDEFIVKEETHKNLECAHIARLVMGGRVNFTGSIPKIMRYSAATNKEGEIVKELMKETTVPTKGEIQAALKCVRLTINL
jgi:hypothetical protein